MWKWGTTTGLRVISLFYLLSASAFGVALALQQHQPWAEGLRTAAQTAAPYAKSAAEAAHEQGIKPAVTWIVRTSHDLTVQVSGWIATPKPVAAIAPAAPKKQIVAKAKPPVAAPIKSEVVTVPPAPPKPELAETEAVAPLEPAPDAAPPSPGEIARVLSHLKVSLTKELYDNFELFLYVSKATHGPWQQRMFVFAKQASGDINLLHTWPVSTGREVMTPGPSGQLYHTNTPQGYFQIDPERVYRRYHSSEWDHDMPHAMFFSWEHDGLQTGIAIHGAVETDITALGTRSSAGCIRIHPQNATLLFRLIKQNYRGSTPLFAYDRRTATMSSNGLLMHDKAGNLQYAEGYKVLVLIENNGGDDIVAALF
jgi:lipoprotein-anchoring transpeptidase ErfK/SrfK